MSNRQSRPFQSFGLCGSCLNTTLKGDMDKDWAESKCGFFFPSFLNQTDKDSDFDSFIVIHLMNVSSKMSYCWTPVLKSLPTPGGLFYIFRCFVHRLISLCIESWSILYNLFLKIIHTAALMGTLERHVLCSILSSKWFFIHFLSIKWVSSSACSHSLQKIAASPYAVSPWQILKIKIFIISCHHFEIEQCP